MLVPNVEMEQYMRYVRGVPRNVTVVGIIHGLRRNLFSMPLIYRILLQNVSS